MTNIAIIYHSGYGHTAALAASVAKGVADANAEATLLAIESASQDFTALIERASKADAIIFGAPTYMGSLSAPFAAFKDATAKIWMQQGWKDKIAAGFTNSGSMSGDKLMSLQQLVVFASQHSMIWVGTGLLPDYSKPTGDVQAINRLGSWLGAMAQSDNVAPDVAPPSGDHETARLLGVRVATITQRFNKAA